MQGYALLICVFFLSLFSQSGFAGPWFTGPLLAPAGHTIAKGHTNLELYAIDVHTNGFFNQNGNFVRTPLFRSFVGNPVLTHGYTDWLDIQLTVPYVFNSTQGINYNNITDTSLTFGIQLAEQKGSPKKMDVRLLIQEIFPTGRFDHLNPALLGTDATGLGSYETRVGIDFQYLKEMKNSHYLRTRLILSYLYSTSVNVVGLSSYGGTINTRGRIRQGDEYDADLAFEYTLTQHWVAVMEGTLSDGSGSRFSGNLSAPNIVGPAPAIGYGSYYETALAPALEYNFTEKVGLIGGVWFPLSGRNTNNYMAYVLALNIYW